MHLHLPTFHVCQQANLGHARPQDDLGAHGIVLNQVSTSFLAWSLAMP